ncbi:MAG TPA: hypothetical protein VK186_22590, partial [Candidatus Deferrimicrobium sp.]|nr:hypothetical protein [Candidatus Deferrimicrobium sp.]
MRIIFPVLLCSFFLLLHAGPAGKNTGARQTIENPYEINIPLLQQKLKPGQIIIKYTLLKNTVYIFFYEKNTMGYRKLNITTSELVNWVNRLTEPLDDFTRGNVDYLHLYYD